MASLLERSAKVVVAVLIMWPSIQKKCESISWIKSKCPACLSEMVNLLAVPSSKGQPVQLKKRKVAVLSPEGQHS